MRIRYREEMVKKEGAKKFPGILQGCRRYIIHVPRIKKTTGKLKEGNFL